ncbi:MAG: hypothetical protein J0M19_02900 [Sphingomonadales bacterium]|nr:hypothetical protein [Sphingomonadales bacterium]
MQATGECSESFTKAFVLSAAPNEDGETRIFGALVVSLGRRGCVSISLQEGEQVRRRLGKRLIALNFKPFADLIAMRAKQIGQDRIHKCPDVDGLRAQFELDTVPFTRLDNSISA